jgi:Protein of unknown function (DUF2852)
MSDVVAKLDDWGLPAWITLMVLGFVIFWPVGLAVLAFLIWSGRMGCGARRRFGRWSREFREQCGGEGRGNTFRSSGNAAFDEYREETIRRLEEEEREFREFLERLRLAKDRAEFDQFMSERKSRPTPPRESNGDGNGGSTGQGPEATGGAVPQMP